MQGNLAKLTVISNFIASNIQMIGIDMCAEDVTTEINKGKFNWPETQVGFTVQIRCPWSFDEPIWAQR